MRAGFTIIEVMITLLISSIVGMSLYQMFFKTSKIVKEIVQIINIDEPIYPIYNQLQNDITGMFAPRATVNFYLKTLDKKDKDKKPEAKDEQPKSPEKEEEKKQDNVVKNVFYVEVKEKGYLFLSFITTGGIAYLEANGSLAPHSFMRRVAYVVEEDPTRPGTLILSYRFNNEALDLDFIKKPGFYPSYKVLSGIKNFSIEFIIFEPSDKKDAPKKSSKIVLKEWKEEEIFEKYKALMPAYITLKGEYTDEVGKVAHPFQFDFKVYGYSNYELPVKPAEKKAEAKKENGGEKKESTMAQITKFFDDAMVKKADNSKSVAPGGNNAAK